MSHCLRLFGAVALEGPQGTLAGAATQQRSLAVLALLAAAHPHGCTRDKLVGHVWPESDQARARHRLADVLHLIRKALGEAAIAVAGETVRLQPTVVHSDVAAFLDALEAGDLESAARHYRGPFLEGFTLDSAPEFERWVESQRQRLGDRYAGALQSLIAQARARGDHVAAAERWKQLLAHDPYNSRFALGLIEALAWSGDPANAWLALREHERLLREDLDVEPPADLRRRATELIRAADATAVTAAPEEISATAGRDAEPVGTAATRPRPIGVRRMRTASVAAAALLTLTGAILAVRGTGTHGVLDPNRVLVVAPVDQRHSEGSPLLGQMVQDYVIQVLTEAGFVEVVDPLTALTVSRSAGVVQTGDPGRDLRALAARAGAGTVVSGAYYAEGDSLVILSRVSDARDGRLLATVGPIVGARDARRALVARVGQAVVASLGSVLSREVGTFEPVVQPSSYEAFALYADGLKAYVGGDWERAGRDFERAVAADSTFARARLWGAQVLVILGRDRGDGAIYARADSLVGPLVATRQHLSRYDRCQLDLVQAFGTQASLSAAYEAARCMARVAPGSDHASLEFAHAARRLNRPAEAIAILTAHDPDRGLYEESGTYRALLSSTYHQLGDHQAELRVIREWRRQYSGLSSLEPADGSVNALRRETLALAALGRLDEVAANLQVLRSLPSEHRELGTDLFLVAVELRVHGHRDAARAVFDEAIAWLEAPHDEPLAVDLGELLYEAERWDDARRVFEERAARCPEAPWSRIFLAKLAARRGERDAASQTSRWLASLRDPVRERDYLLERAKIAALLGEREEAMALLRQAIERGARWGFRSCWPVGDIDFDPLRDYPPFQEFVRPKG